MLKVYLNRIINKVDFKFSNKKIVVYKKATRVSKKNKTITSVLKQELKVALKLFKYLFKNKKYLVSKKRIYVYITT